jgi:hypothetical protein
MHLKQISWMNEVLDIKLIAAGCVFHGALKLLHLMTLVW